MRVVGLGVSVLKGAAQQHPDRLLLDGQGPVLDRRYALVDPVGARVLRTIENPRLLALQAAHTAAPGPGGPGAVDTLVVDVPGHGRHEVPVRPVGTLRADYWGRACQLAVLGGAAVDTLVAALAEHLGRHVLLARARRRDVVYGEGVTLVTTSSLAEVERRRAVASGTAERDRAELLEDAERWRAALVVDTPGLPPFVEDGWHGHRLQVGTGGQAVRLQVTAGVARCGVVRGRPRDGRQDGWDPLRLLAPDRLVRSPAGQEVAFAVGAEVAVPGEVLLGDPVTVQP